MSVPDQIPPVEGMALRKTLTRTRDTCAATFFSFKPQLYFQ
jgi:hypothetical protein